MGEILDIDRFDEKLAESLYNQPVIENQTENFDNYIDTFIEKIKPFTDAYEEANGDWEEYDGGYADGSVFLENDDNPLMLNDVEFRASVVTLDGPSDTINDVVVFYPKVIANEQNLQTAQKEMDSGFDVYDPVNDDKRLFLQDNFATIPLEEIVDIIHGPKEKMENKILSTAVELMQDLKHKGFDVARKTMDVSKDLRETLSWSNHHSSTSEYPNLLQETAKRITDRALQEGYSASDIQNAFTKFKMDTIQMGYNSDGLHIEDLSESYQVTNLREFMDGKNQFLAANLIDRCVYDNNLANQCAFSMEQAASQHMQALGKNMAQADEKHR